MISVILAEPKNREIYVVFKRVRQYATQAHADIISRVVGLAASNTTIDWFCGGGVTRVASRLGELALGRNGL